MQFRVIMFIEAGDVTHRRRGQNRNEEFRDFFLSNFIKVFYINFFLTENVYFGIILPEMMKIKIFGKNQNFVPLNF